MQRKQHRSQVISYTTKNGLRTRLGTKATVSAGRSLYGDCNELLAVSGFTTVQKLLPDLEPRHLSDPFRLKPSLVVILIKMKLN